MRRDVQLRLAAKAGDTATVTALLAAGADVHGKGAEGYGRSFPVQPLDGCDGRVCWRCRLTALHFASMNGHTETAKALVAAGADVHCTNTEGYGQRTTFVLQWRAASFWLAV